MGNINRDLLIKLIVVFLAIIQPIITLFVFGVNFQSFSKLYGTCLEPLFVVTSATTSFYLYQSEKWKISAVLLLLLMAFSTEVYSTIHNILAVGFFISVFYPLWRNKLFLWLYSFSAVFALLGLFWFETFAIWVICAYHLNILYILWKFENRNKI